MYIIKSEDHFDSAHFLAGYQGKCGNIHGHRWTVEVEVAAEDLMTDEQNRDMVTDFGDVKKELKKITNDLDHKLVIEKGSLKEKTIEALKEENFEIVEVEFRPTAECFSKYFFDEMSYCGLNVFSVTVYETPKNYARYVRS